MNVSKVPSAVRALQIAQQFAAKAANRPLHQQFHQLLQFLRGPAHGKVQTMEFLEQLLARKLEQFHSTEVGISGEGRDRLARPGGPADANLGLVLHVQSEDDVLGGFWDSRSATISLLHEKGIHETFASGYDWHWRVQGRFHRNARCPASAWNQQLREFYNQFSSDLLAMLPLPLVITTSSCTRENLRKYLRKTATSLEIKLAAPTSVMRFDLDIRIDGTLRRIILHVPHVPRSPSVLHRPLVDEIDIPTPLDDSYEDNDADQGLPIGSEAGSDEAGKPTTCHGTDVKVYKNGTVIISSTEFPLEFRTSKARAQKICSFGSTPRIYFSPTDIEIRVNKEVVHTKSIERLLGSLEGAQWLSRLILEEQAFQGTPHEDEYAEAEPHSSLDLISHERHGGTYKNGERKRKLLQGASFHCAQFKSRGAHTENRVFF
ncbi:hypothetical protein MMC18_001801 [Xylographa bjoerkii]|nr:hypothetical protein [Xylographa bjoerkii]